MLWLEDMPVPPAPPNPTIAECLDALLNLLALVVVPGADGDFSSTSSAVVAGRRGLVMLRRWEAEGVEIPDALVELELT